jgi:hypothetical protein
MTSIELFINHTQQVGPLQIWPMRWTGLSSLEYHVPPKIDQLIFREYDEGEGPEIGRIEVFNPTQIPVLIPGGWVVGGDLLQVRTFDNSEFIAPLKSVIANVSCVERGRWGEGKTEVDSGRAPLSVHASGRTFNSKRGRWDIDYASRQQSVWRQVARLEERGGSRPTSSLQQIMQEDSTSLNIASTLQGESQRILQIFNGQNGILIAFEGVPLLLEAFSSAKALQRTIQSTVRSLSFDIDHLSFTASTKEKVKSFIQSASIERLGATEREISTQQVRSGGQGVETNALRDSDGRFIHITALNREHRILQEV